MGLKAEARMLIVCDPAFATLSAVEKVAGVELNARLGGNYFNSAAGNWIPRHRSLLKASRILEHECVIVSRWDRADPSADELRSPEVEGGVDHRLKGSERDKRVINRNDRLRVDLNPLLEHVA